MIKSPLRVGIVLTLSAVTPLVAADDLFFADQEMPVVLSATRLKQAIADAPASITIIDRQMIEQTAARELPELLRLVPGMVVGYESGWEAFVSYHGTSADMARRMQVLVDGRSVYQPSLAFVDWIGLPLELDDIDHIEVVRGPNAAAFGSNSFLGVVNIITRAPADLPSVRAYTRSGANGIKDNFVSQAGVKDSISWQISANSRHDNGYSTDFRKTKLKDSQGNNVKDADNNDVIVFDPYPYPDDKRQKAVYGQMVWEPNLDSKIMMSAGHSELFGGEMVDSGVVEFLAPPDLTAKQNYVNLSLEHSFSNHQWQLQADYSEFSSHQKVRVNAVPAYFLPELQQMFVRNRLYADDFLGAAADLLGGEAAEFPVSDDAVLTNLSLTVQCKIGIVQGDECAAINVYPTMESLTGLTTPINYISDVSKRETRIEVEVQDTWTLTPELRVVYGAGIQDSKADSEHYFNGEVENTVWRVFAHGEWQFLPNWRLNAGLMDEHDDYAGHLQSPRLALNWRFAPTHSLRLVTSRAYRTPDLRESKAYWQYKATTEDRSLSQYDGSFPYLGQAPQKEGTSCAYTDSYTGGTPAFICTNGAPTERIISREIGYYGELPKQHLQIDIRVFKDDLHLSEHNLEVDDFVIAPLNTHQQRGIEVSTQWRPVANWRFLANYAYDDISFTNDNTDFVPKHSGNLGAWYDGSQGIQTSLSYVFYNQLYNDSDDGGLYFDRLDWRIAKKWSLHKKHDVELSGVWQIRLTEDTELRRNNGAPRDKVWLGLSYLYD